MSFNPTPKQRANLAKLADYLDALPDDYERFDMDDFHDSASLDEVIAGRPISCGSAACAIGHGPAAGIRRHSSDMGCWFDYAIRVFGTDHEGEAGYHMFGTENPDCPKAAASRIREVLEGKFS